MKIADGICRQVAMTSCPTQLGSRCRVMIRLLPAPSTFSAVMNSMLFNCSTWPLTIRAMLTQYNRANTIKILTIPGPRSLMALARPQVDVSNHFCRGSEITTCRRRTIRVLGMEMIRSMIRMITKSTTPPQSPDIAPMAAPITSTISAAIIPIIRDTRVPYMLRAMMSLPEESVPNT